MYFKLYSPHKKSTLFTKTPSGKKIFINGPKAFNAIHIRNKTHDYLTGYYNKHNKNVGEFKTRKNEKLL